MTSPAEPHRVTPAWRRYFRFWGARVAADVDAELRFHFEMRVRDYAARGLSDEAARRAAAQRLGDLRRTRATCLTIGERRERRMTRAQTIDAVMQDVRFGLRTLGRQKAWAAVAVLTLALGIGANTAIFSVVNSLILHPLPYPHAERVVIVYQEPSVGNNTGMHVMVTPQANTVRAWRTGSRSFEDIEPFASSDMTLQSGAAPPSVVHTASVLPSFPGFAGVHPLVGRGFTEGDVVDGRAVILSETVWHVRFASDTAVIGKSVTLDDNRYTIVGVLPATLRTPSLQRERTDFWLPLDLRGNAMVVVAGRLRPGATLGRAARELDSLAARADVGATLGKFPSFRTKLERPSEMVSFRDSLIMLTAAVALVLLIACANVAHLLLARAATRQRELAIRAALGAGSGRLFRQLLTESLLLAAAGCAGGVALGWAGLRTLVAMRPERLSELSAAEMDTTTLLATVGLSMLTGIVLGVIGAVQARHHSTHEALKTGALSTSASRSHQRVRSLLVVSEMALSATLLVGATLLVRSVMHLQQIDPGFTSAGLYSLSVNLPKSSYGTSAAKAAFYDALETRARVMPGVQSVTLAAAAPGGRAFMIGALQVDDEPAPPPGTTAFIDYNGVATDYFRILGMRILEGSTFTDTTTAAAQVIVNEGLARKYWPTTSALGHRLRVVYNGQGVWKRVVGVVNNAFTGGLMTESSVPFVYTPGTDFFMPTLIVRVAPGSTPLPALRGLVSRLDPHLPAPHLTSTADAMASSIAGPRFTMMLLAVFTVLAVVLATVGLYGVLAYAVAQRTREIGIRIALGASRRDIARSVVRQGVLLACAGMVIGLVAARAAATIISSMLYGVAPTDPVSFALGATALITTALVACAMPARRAVSVDPLIAMRQE